MIGFERTKSVQDVLTDHLLGLSGELSAKDSDRVRRIRKAWDYYEGYHWEDMPEVDTPEITVNYCRAFVDKFVAFELGKGFSINVKKDLQDVIVDTKENRTVSQYLESVWKDNSGPLLLIDIGQMKSVTGEAWIQVRYYSPEELDDPLQEFPNGCVKLLLMPTETVFPEFDPKQRDVLLKLTIMYSYEKLEKTPILGKEEKKRVTYKQIWTKDEIAVIDDGIEEVYPNRYGIIPFVQIKNLTEACKNEGRGDLDDIIPLNTEYNMKKSNVSEILDYHSAPITIVYGAKIGNLEKGANKMWGGLSKDARVENLELRSDLGASSSYISDTKLSMCEVGGIPETVLGGAQAISNTSGVALQYINLPLIEKTRFKKMSTETGLEKLNKYILLISILEGLIIKPDSIELKDLFWNEVKLAETLPKDLLLELQQIQLEMKLGLESRRNAMKRLNKDNVDDLIREIDMDLKENPCLYGHIDPNDQLHNPQVNSGMINGQTPIEQTRIETTGLNGGAE